MAGHDSFWSPSVCFQLRCAGYLWLIVIVRLRLKCSCTSLIYVIVFGYTKEIIGLNILPKEISCEKITSNLKSLFALL